MTILDEVRARVDRQRSAAALEGLRLEPPLLILGTSERVGSNWLSDTLGGWWQQHNEPFRQQLDASHPLSSVNTLPKSWPDVTDEDLGPLGQHWLATFAVGKYGVTRQTIKETNLFFATSTVLRLFPDAPVVIASRSPLGVISSFERGNLFTAWAYHDRYRQLAAAAAQPPTKQWSALLPDDDPDRLTALARLIVVNSLLLADAAQGRPVVHVPYEQAVLHPAATLQAIGELTGSYLKLPPTHAAPSPGGDDTFATTTAKDSLEAHLSPYDAERIRETVAELLDAARHMIAPPVLTRATTWLAGDHCYCLRPVAHRLRTAPAIRDQVVRTPLAWIMAGTAEWRNLLVTNDEFSDFLNDLADAGLANTYQGTHLLVVPMPAGRGGRLRLDSGRWTVQPGYAQHPAYWVTWIGAAAFAAHAGGRLPTRIECDQLAAASSAIPMNTAYEQGDVVSAIEAGRRADEIHHRLGNVQIWCADGPEPQATLAGPAVRWLHGAAWNTPGTPEQIHRPRHRHLLGASRGVGIRLVRDPGNGTVPAAVLADLLHDWIRSLADRDRSLADLDAPVIAALIRLQADGRLRPHIRARTGEP